MEPPVFLRVHSSVQAFSEPGSVKRDGYDPAVSEQSGFLRTASEQVCSVRVFSVRDAWLQAVGNILSTFRDQQHKDGNRGKYRFERNTTRQLDTMSNNGWGMRALLPKEALKDIYVLYLSEVSGS